MGAYGGPDGAYGAYGAYGGRGIFRGQKWGGATTNKNNNKNEGVAAGAFFSGLHKNGKNK